MALPKSGHARVPAGFEAHFHAFQRLPNVGKATAEDMVRLRIRGVTHLARQEPLAMYRKLCRMDGVRHDPCVIDVFMAVVEHARTGRSKPWWKYTPARKAMTDMGTKGAATAKRPRRASRPKSVAA